MIQNKIEIIEQLTQLKRRLLEDVSEGYSVKGIEFGRNRYEALKRKTKEVLDGHFPGESERFAKNIICYSFSPRNRWQDTGLWFLEHDGSKYSAYIDSLIMDLNNDEYIPPATEGDNDVTEAKSSAAPNNKIFIVHGHGEAEKEKTARFISKMGLEPVILHEQVSQGKTIIEKLEHYTDVGFGIVLYTEDDLGNTASAAEKGDLKSRARQNVVFEHGLLIGLLGRARVMPIVAGNVELPGDISGVVYINTQGWQLTVAQELKSAGYDIDLNKAFG